MWERHFMCHSSFILLSKRSVLLEESRAPARRRSSRRRRQTNDRRCLKQALRRRPRPEDQSGSARKLIARIRPPQSLNDYIERICVGVEVSAVTKARKALLEIEDERALHVQMQTITGELSVMVCRGEEIPLRSPRTFRSVMSYNASPKSVISINSHARSSN